MHVCWWVLECVVEALGLYGALVADVSGCFYVCDVFVVFGEHLVGFAFAVGVVHPTVCYIHSLYIG